MAYRYFCIYEKLVGGHYKLRVEVALDTGGKSLLPFKRKMTLLHLQNVADNQNQYDLISFLCQSGTAAQSPFEINNVSLLSYNTVVVILQRQPFSYLQYTTRKSMSRI